MSRLRVLHVIGPMATGGAQTQLLGLVRAAHGRLWDAHVCGTSPGEMTAAFVDAGVPTVELDRWGSPGLLRIAKLHSMVKRGRFDIVHSNLWQANAFARIAVVGRRPRPGVVISERGIDAERGRAKRIVDACLRPVTDAWVGNSEVVVEFIREAHRSDRDRTLLIPNAIDKEVFSPVPAPAPRSAGRVSVIGVVGRLTWEKGHEVLLSAVEELIARGEQVKLRVAGGGPLESDLRARAIGLPVDFIGPLEPGAPVAEFLGSLDVFVLPSHVEGRPNAVLESMSRGIPTVVSDAPGCVEAAAGGAVIFPRGDHSELARAIIRVLQRPCDARQLALAARMSVPDFDRLAEQYEEIFAALVRWRA